MTTTAPPATIATRIKAAMPDDMSGRQLAACAGLNYVTVARTLSGKRDTHITIHEVTAIAGALGVPVASLLPMIPAPRTPA